MLVLYPDRLSTEDRTSLTAVLSAEPIFAEPFRPWPPLAFVLAAGASLCAAAVSIFFGAAGTYSWSVEARAVIHAIAVVIAVTMPLLALRARRASTQARGAPFRCGRFLYPFGFVDARPDRVEIIEGRRLGSVLVSIGKPALSGASRIRIQVGRGPTRRALHFIGCDLDVPSDLVEVLSRGTLDVVDGYRGARPAFSSHVARPLRDRGSSMFVGAICIIACAALALAWCSVLPARALAELGASDWSSIEAYEALPRVYPFPWVRAEAHAAVDERLERVGRVVDTRFREPWRSELAEVVRRRRAGVRMEWFTEHDRCPVDAEQEHAIDRWVAERAGGSSCVSLYPAYAWMSSLFPSIIETSTRDAVVLSTYGATQPASASRAVLALRCTMTAERLVRTGAGIAHAIIRIEAEATLRVGFRPPIQAHASIETEAIESNAVRPSYSLVLSDAYGAIREQFSAAIYEE